MLYDFHGTRRYRRQLVRQTAHQRSQEAAYTARLRQQRVALAANIHAYQVHRTQALGRVLARVSQSLQLQTALRGWRACAATAAAQVRTAMARQAVAAAPRLAMAAAVAARALTRRRLVHPIPHQMPPPPLGIPLLPPYTTDPGLDAAFAALPHLPAALPSDAARRGVAASNQANLASGSVQAAAAVPVPSPPPPALASGPPTHPSTTLTVVPCDVVTAAITLSQQMMAPAPIAVLNFANSLHPGGGYLRGRTAQEEDLCRAIPALFPALASSNAYPLDPAAAPPVIRADIWRAPPFSAFLPIAIPITVITAAAPNRDPNLQSPVQLDSATYRADFIERMHNVLRAAHAAGCSTVILGAWGCGVFRNRANDVASLWCTVLDSLEWRGRFACVVFAIPSHGPGRSLAIFRRTLASLAP